MTQFFSAALGAPRPSREKAFLDWARIAEQAQGKLAPEWAIPEAFLAVLFSAAAADGDLVSEERDTLLALMHRSRALKALSLEQLATLNSVVADRLKTGAQKALSDACAALPAEMRPSAFAQAFDIILADGELNQAEADYLNALVGFLKIDRSDVERIADIIVLKNRF